MSNIKNKETEPCTSCGKKTEVSIGETDIRLRPGDLENGSVLCEKCFVKNIVVSYRSGNMNDEQKMNMINEHAKRRQDRRGNTRLNKKYDK